MLTNTSRISKLTEWINLLRIEYLKNRTWLLIYFQKSSFSADVTFKYELDLDHEKINTKKDLIQEQLSEKKEFLNLFQLKTYVTIKRSFIDAKPFSWNLV